MSCEEDGKKIQRKVDKLNDWVRTGQMQMQFRTMCGFHFGRKTRKVEDFFKWWEVEHCCCSEGPG